MARLYTYKKNEATYLTVFDRKTNKINKDYGMFSI
jgi:hypothetical protein